MANGMKYFNLNIPKKFNISTIKISDYIPVIMKRFKVKDYHIVNAVKILEFVKLRSSLLNSSCPQGVASAICFCYLKLAKKNVKCEDFSEISGLSKVTIINLNVKFLMSFYVQKIKPILLTREVPE